MLSFWNSFIGYVQSIFAILLFKFQRERFWN